MDASPGVARSTTPRQSDESYQNSGPENLPELTDNVNRQNEAKWAARLVGAGSLLTLIYETAFLVLDRRFLSLSDPPVLIFHSINIALFLLAVFMVARVGPWMRRRWKPVAFSFSTLMIVSSACIAVETGKTSHWHLH